MKMTRARAKRFLPGPFLAAYRSARSAYEDAVDRLANRITGKDWLPPVRLRREVGPLSAYEIIGTQQVLFLQLLCGLQPRERILDIGCGCGRVALPLAWWLGPAGTYVGMDIDRRAIDWCRQQITPKYPNFSFCWADIRNQRYNPAGQYLAAAYTFPFPQESFDLIHLRSVFTHMKPDETSHYLGEIARLLTPQGRCLTTFFLFGKTKGATPYDGIPPRSFPFGDNRYRYVDPAMPEEACAYAIDYVEDLVAKSGLKLQRPPICGLSGQDILLLERA